VGIAPRLSPRDAQICCYDPKMGLSPVFLMVAVGVGGSLKIPDPPPQPIYGGIEVGPNEWNAVVAILAGSSLCSGTVVAKNLVLTAGHCLANHGGNQPLDVFFDRTLSAGNKVEAESFGVHPDFCSGSGCRDDIFDFGYVIVANDFTLPEGNPFSGFAVPIVSQEEWDEAIRKNTEVTLVGYGETEEESNDAGIGIKRSVVTELTDVSPKGLEFQAGGAGRDTCVGDSGGPAFVQLENGQWRFAGVTSRGSSPCGTGGYYGAPYASLCWLREETGVDLLPADCSACDCLDTAPDSEKRGCRVAGAAPPNLFGFLILLLGWRTLRGPNRRPSIRANERDR
jgi:hypothetical protein